MAAIKCGNCGATIPDKAAFCPGCGSPKAVQPATPSQPMVMRQPMHTSNPFENLFNIIFSKTLIIGGTAIATLLAWVGLIISMYSNTNIREAMLISTLGFGILGILLIGGGIWNNKINQYVRLAMVFIGVYLLVQALSITGIFSSFASAFSGFIG